jgi:3-phosphoshikimate 1-carboxyvinyltransferase
MKESDRLHSVSEMINSLGGKANELDDGVIIEGVGLRGGEVFSFNDHRIVMAASVLASVSDGVTIINGAEAVQKSYPDFFADFIKLGGEAEYGC